MPGEIADMMISGAMCEGCGEYLGGGDGFPVTCAACGGADDDDDDEGGDRPPISARALAGIRRRRKAYKKRRKARLRAEREAKALAP